MLKTPTTPRVPVATVSQDPPGSPLSASRSRLWLKSLVIMAIVVSAILAVGAVASRSTVPTVDQAQLTHRISRSDLLVTVTEQGTLESSNNVEVRSKVWGWKTVNWVIESGAMVKAGDVLVRLDASEMEKKVDEAKINYQNSRADMITAESNVSVAAKSVTEYLQGTFIEERGGIMQEIFDAEQAVTQAELAYKSSERLAAKGLYKALQLRGDQFKLESAQQKLELKKTRLRSLETYKKEKEQERLDADLRAAEARLEAAKARLDLSKTNLTQHEEQLRFHTIAAPQDGMVIHPKAAEWRDAPDVEEGANVHTNQVLLIMPDMTRMQVKVGIHESMIDRVDAGLPATVTIGGTTIQGEVSEVAKVTKPATWYTGNVVKFDTIVALDGQTGLKPGLSAEVQVIIAEHKDVLTIPVAAVVESGDRQFCWVKEKIGAQRRAIELGDSNDLFVVVQAGLKEGDEVVLNPVAYLDEAQQEVLQPQGESESEGELPGGGQDDGGDPGPIPPSAVSETASVSRQPRALTA